MNRTHSDTPPATVVVGYLIALAGVVAVLAGLSGGGGLLVAGVVAVVLGALLVGHGSEGSPATGRRRWLHDAGDAWYDVD